MSDPQTVQSWPFERIVPEEDEAIYELLASVQVAFDDVDVEVQALSEQRFLDTATGVELEKFGREVGVTRETNEPDDELRSRIRIARVAARSDGTIEDIGAIFDLLFDSPERITIGTVTGEPALEVDIPSEMIDAIPLTRAQLEDELLSVVPAGDGIQITTFEDFAFDGTSDGQGFDQGTWA